MTISRLKWPWNQNHRREDRSRYGLEAVRSAPYDVSVDWPTDGSLLLSKTRTVAKKCKDTIAEAAVDAGRSPDEIGYQMMLDVPPRDASGKSFYQDLSRVKERADAVREMGFEWGAVNATAIFQSGARSVDAMIDVLGQVHDAIGDD